MINNVIAFIQWSIFSLGLLLLTSVLYIGLHSKKIADVGLLHCAAMIQGEAELMQRQADLQMREIEFQAIKESLPVCKKK